MNVMHVPVKQNAHRLYTVSVHSNLVIITVRFPYNRPFTITYICNHHYSDIENLISAHSSFQYSVKLNPNSIIIAQRSTAF